MSDDLSGFSMMDLFRMEAEERLAVLSQGLVGSKGPVRTAAIEPLMRTAHSLKGAARVVGLDAAVQVAHAMEDGLVAAQKGRVALQAPEGVDALLRGVDLLTQVSGVSEGEIGAWEESHAGEVGGGPGGTTWPPSRREESPHRSPHRCRPRRRSPSRNRQLLPSLRPP